MGTSDGLDRRRPFAVVDIGSNSLRLVVFERLARAALVLFNEKAVCALGRGLPSTGKLDPAAIEPALQALRRFGRIARAMGVSRLDAVATEASRRAQNGKQFLDRAREALEAPITVLSGDEEAHAAATGVAYSFWRAEGICGDLGGGSIDLAHITGGRPSEPYASLQLGTLVVQAAMAEGRDGASRVIDRCLAEASWLRGAARGRTFYVVGGGWRALARIRLALTDAPLKVVHGYALDAQTAATLGRSLTELEPDAVAMLPGIPRRRLDTVPAAALLLERVVDLLEPDSVTFSATGLREGRLFAQLPPAELEEDPLLAGCADFALARARRAEIGAALAEWTAPLFTGEKPPQRRLRLAACALADTAWRDHPDTRAREALVRLSQYPFLGVGHAERAFLGLAIYCRYEGDPGEPAIAPLLGLMAEPDRRRAEALGAALQLAFRICGGVPELLDAASIERRRDELVLKLGDRAFAPDDVSLRGRLQRLAERLGIGKASVAA